MSAAKQPAFDFGLPDTMRARKEPWMAADARRDAHAKQTASRKERMWGRVMEYARAHENFTADEVAAEWRCSPNHVAPRITELLQLGRLRMTGERRRTRSGGMAAVLAAKGEAA